MSNPIWNVDLFTKISKEQAECNDCKKAGRTKYVFELAHASVKSLVTHMNTKLHADEYSERYRQLVEQQKQSSSSNEKMSKFVNIIGRGIFYHLFVCYQLKYTHFIW
jgi:non-homologous end joining protein Ku